jgi:DNA-nicking Smr family endonuclease
METISEDKSILDELKLHFKDFNSDIIEALYNSNNKDISKTIDALIESSNLQNLYDNKEQKEEPKENKEDNKIEEDDDYFLFNDNKKEKEKKDDNNNINKINIENEDNNNNIIEKEKDNDDNVLNFLIELAPFNTVEEIEEKIILYNFDYDKVIASLLDNYKSDNNANQESDDKNKFNDLKTSLRNKKEKRRKKEKREKKDKIEKDEGERRYRKYDEYKVLEFLEKNKNKQRIDLHGFKLSESMIIVKKKLEEMEQIVKENKVEKLLIIVTGRGNHSPGNKPVLRPNILRWLKSKNYNVNEKDPGALYVLIQ